MLSAVILSARGYPALRLASQLVHYWRVHSGPLVLGAAPLNFRTPTADRDRTVSRRSEPSSRTTLIGEQPNPWDLLQPQDVMSRHRGAKPPRRCELLGEISLLSPAYLLSVEWWPFHEEPPDHYDQLSFLFDLSVSQSGRLLPLYSTADFRPAWAYHRTPPVLFRRRPPQSNYPPCMVPNPVFGSWLGIKSSKGGISRLTPQKLAFSLHRLPPILHIKLLIPMQSYSKGARGLSVWPRVPRIFTGNPISLSWCWRQRGSRYAIHARRNLPDKEFRYLRTVIVTAAVHRGFNLELALFLLTFRHRAGVRPYTSSFRVSRALCFW